LVLDVLALSSITHPSRKFDGHFCASQPSPTLQHHNEKKQPDKHVFSKINNKMIIRWWIALIVVRVCLCFVANNNYDVVVASNNKCAFVVNLAKSSWYVHNSAPFYPIPIQSSKLRFQKDTKSYPNWTKRTLNSINNDNENIAQVSSTKCQELMGLKKVNEESLPNRRQVTFHGSLQRRKTLKTNNIPIDNRQEWAHLTGAIRRKEEQNINPKQNSYVLNELSPTINNGKRSVIDSSSSILETILDQYGYKNERFRVLSKQQLPALAEVYVNGKARIINIIDFTYSNSSSTTNNEPKFIIEYFDAELQTIRQMVVDIGQLTSIWTINCSGAIVLQSLHEAIEKSQTKIPQKLKETLLDKVYSTYWGRSRFSTKGVNKKQIDTIIRQSYTDSKLNNERSVADAVLRKVVKAGNKYCRVIDSTILSEGYLYKQKTSDKSTTIRRSICSNLNVQLQHAVAATILADDSETGGRFKRWPCMFISSSTRKTSNNNAPTDIDNTISYINGGWLVVDQSVRANEEARKFTDRMGVKTSTTNDDTTTHDSIELSTSNKGHHNGKVALKTKSDRRIIRRLECLAMDSRKQQQIDVVDGSDTVDSLELDIRGVLNKMQLPLSSEGAKLALLKLGHWSPSMESGTRRFQPWSSDILQASEWYINTDLVRQQSFRDNLLLSRNKAQTRGDSHYPSSILRTSENRTDMSKYRSICIDSKRTAFRDDAIGIRRRTDNTGKRCIEGSNYELLIHIADVTDFYVNFPQVELLNLPNDSKQYLSILRSAAESRVTSRYDLSSGPLHLLPPNVLEILSFSNRKENHRCITLWVYMDEKNGKIVDAGFERSVISTPTFLSYEEASDILDSTDINMKSAENSDIVKIRAQMLMAEHILSNWTLRRQENSISAAKREARLASREAAYQETGLNVDESVSNSIFQRTRAHRIVDSSLSLYSLVAYTLLQKSGTPLPIVQGADKSRDGRVATAPLRRYVDGVTQAQIVATSLNYGKPWTLAECIEVGKTATDTIHDISNLRVYR
jgi:RNB domain